VTRLLCDLEQWRGYREGIAGRSIGFVPTMGALHEGHRALLRRARAENEVVVASIFVNPTQFDDPADLDRYPRNLDADMALVEGLADAVFAPTPGELYKDAYRYRATEYTLSTRWEGAHRPGHFDGVLTVVLKLLNLVTPGRAYFGEKDWQQLQLVRGMVRAFFVPVDIIACETVRDADGLAMSSRNRRLSAAGRSKASAFPRILRESPTAEEAVRALKGAGFEVDYVADTDGVRLGAIRLEGVRLIDNLHLENAARP
jgi:pantoate--beta-alanine ligase